MRTIACQRPRRIKMRRRAERMTTNQILELHLRLHQSTETGRSISPLACLAFRMVMSGFKDGSDTSVLVSFGIFCLVIWNGDGNPV